MCVDDNQTKYTAAHSNDVSSGISNSVSHYLSKEVRYGSPLNKLDEYVNNKRNEIYARMRLPKILVNHYVASASMSNVSVVDEIPYDIFNWKSTLGSKSVFSREDSMKDSLIKDLEPATPIQRKRLVILEDSQEEIGRRGELIWTDGIEKHDKGINVCCSVFR